ncbi:MAG: hypothetical protein WBA41_09740 [Rivularia sp. (in: cyanobacteria)]
MSLSFIMSSLIVNNRHACKIRSCANRLIGDRHHGRKSSFILKLQK